MNDVAELMSVIDYFMWYMLLFAAVVFIISGFDDLIFDISYWVRALYRLWTTRHYKKFTYQDLLAVKQRPVALFVPCWEEEFVISDMVEFNLRNIDYSDYEIFIGVYPNDSGTLEVTKKVEMLNDKVHCVVNVKPGPTTKADNLNSIYRYFLEYEKASNKKFAVVVMHDAEDIIHPLFFRLLNFLIPKKQFIQLPIFPLEVSIFNWTHWTYNDEFAELHLKDLVVREAIKGFVPSAGTGTGFDPELLKRQAAENNGAPFDITTFTEDYSSALHMQIRDDDKKVKAIFLMQSILRLMHKPTIFDKNRLKMSKEYVAGRSLFPTSYNQAVRQRTRWILGIVFQEWKVTGWPGNWMIKYMLFHDRKSIATHFLGGFFYIIFFYWLCIFIFSLFDPGIATLSYYFDAHPWFYSLVYITSFLMFNRLLQRFIATFRIYGFIPAVFSIPRTLYANIINMNSLINAYLQFFSRDGRAKKLTWSKTVNRFPSEKQLAKYRRKIGDIFLENNMTTVSQLTEALKVKGDKLGYTLLKNHLISEDELCFALAKTYNLDYVDADKYEVLNLQQIPQLNSENYRWLMDHYFIPIKLEDSTLTLAIADPGVDLKHTADVIEKIIPLNPKFVLRKWTGA